MSTDWWDDFTNNLSTDIAPLIALFGENPTKQYLSECLNFTDVFIFAMAPLGILTTIVSAIRVAGTPGLRAFIGRAKEGGGQAEAELCSSTSREVCELYNSGGIARVFGRPKLLEIVYDKEATNDDFYHTQVVRSVVRENVLMKKLKPPTAGLYTFKEYIGHLAKNGKLGKEGEWNEEGVKLAGLPVKNDDHHFGFDFDQEKNEPTQIENILDFAPNPNLSLNVGIKRRPKWVFTAAALLGFVLQSSVVVWAFVARYKFGLSRESSEDTYALPMVSIGTVLLCGGNGLCAWLVEKATKERTFRRNNAAACGSISQIYWVQPGIQYIGDQAFDSFMYSDISNPLSVYTTSWKDTTSSFHPAQIWIAITASVLGFILQFLGMRGCHSSVILAQLGATCVMSTVRAILRTDRLSTSDNVMGDSPDRYQGHELDWLALNIDNPDAFKRRSRETVSVNVIGESRQEKSDHEKFWQVVTYSKHVDVEILDMGSKVLFCNKGTTDCVLAVFKATVAIANSHHANTFAYMARLMEGINPSNDPPYLRDSRTRGYLFKLTDYFEWRKKVQSGEAGNKPNKAATVFLHRYRLSELTRALKWEEDDLVTIRDTAESLARAIETTVNFILSRDLELKNAISRDRSYALCWKLECCISGSDGSRSPAVAGSGESVYITVKRSVSNEGVLESSWEADRSEIESILGLWCWSFRGRMEENSSRLLGVVELVHQTRTLKHEIYAVSRTLRQLEQWQSHQSQRIKLRLLHATSTSRHTQYFRYHGWQNIPQNDDAPRTSLENDLRQFVLLVLFTRNSVLVNCAQDIYALFFRSLLHLVKVEDLGLETKLEFTGPPAYQASTSLHHEYHFSNTIIDKLQEIFTDSGLGSNDDSFACIIPALMAQEKLPSVVNAFAVGREAAEKYIKEERWRDAAKSLIWCINHVKLPDFMEFEETLNISPDYNTSKDSLPVNLWRLLVLELCECYRLAALQDNERDESQRFGCRKMLDLLENCDIYELVGEKVPLLFLAQASSRDFNSARPEEQLTIDLTLAKTIHNYARFCYDFRKKKLYRFDGLNFSLECKLVFCQLKMKGFSSSQALESYEAASRSTSDTGTADLAPPDSQEEAQLTVEEAQHREALRRWRLAKCEIEIDLSGPVGNICEALELGDMARTLGYLSRILPNNYEHEVIIRTATLLAARNGWYMVVKRLVELSPTVVHFKGDDGRDALSFAAESGDINTVLFLLKKLDPNPISGQYEGVTPFADAVSRGKLGEVCRIIGEERAKYSWEVEFAKLLERSFMEVPID